MPCAHAVSFAIARKYAHYRRSCLVIQGINFEAITRETAMTQSATEPNITTAGIAFTVRVDSVNRDCIISNEALAKLCKLKDGNPDPVETFRAFEATINGVARRLVTAGVPGTPLMLGPHSFQ
jgi:hypothetical protein